MGGPAVCTGRPVRGHTCPRCAPGSPTRTPWWVPRRWHLIAVLAVIVVALWPRIDSALTAEPSGPIRQVFGADHHFTLLADLGFATVDARDGCLVLRTGHGTYVPAFSIPATIVEDGHAIVVETALHGSQTLRIGSRVHLTGGWVGELADTYSRTGCHPGPLNVGSVEAGVRSGRPGAPRPPTNESGFSFSAA